MGSTLSTPIISGTSSADWANALGAILCSLLFVVILMAFFVVLFYRIFHRAGYNGWLGLLALIPGFGALICLCILAFDVWPAKRQQDESAVRCQLPGYGEGTFLPDPPAAPTPAPVPAPTAPTTPMYMPAPQSSAAVIPPPPVVPPEPAVSPTPPVPPTPPVSPEPSVPPAPAVPPEPSEPPAHPTEGGQTL